MTEQQRLNVALGALSEFSHNTASTAFLCYPHGPGDWSAITAAQLASPTSTNLRLYPDVYIAYLDSDALQLALNETNIHTSLDPIRAAMLNAQPSSFIPDLSAHVIQNLTP